MSARTYTDAQLADAVRTSPNMRQVLIKLRLVARGGNYESVRRRIEELGLPSDHLRRTRRPPYTSFELFEAVQSSRSFAQLLTRLGLGAGGNRARVKARITELGLDTSHFVGEAWRKGATTPVTPAVPLEQLLGEEHQVEEAPDRIGTQAVDL